MQEDWEKYRQQFVRHYELDKSAEPDTVRDLKETQARLRDWVAANRDDLVNHIHQWRRLVSQRDAPTGDMPFEQKRTAEKQSGLAGEASGWLAEVKALEHDFHDRLEDDLSDDQRARPPLAERGSPIERVDRTTTYVILGVGLLLLVGLFTRLACLAGAAFLLSVVAMQPFWVAGAAPTFKETIEMVALVMLATTPVGRWAGLDFFLAYLFASKKGNRDVSQS